MFSGKLKLYKQRIARYMKGRREVCRCLFISYLITSFSEFQNNIMCKDVCLTVCVNVCLFQCLKRSFCLNVHVYVRVFNDRYFL